MEGERKAIQNEYDFSNLLPILNGIAYLVQYCEKLDQNLSKVEEEEEERNKPLRDEYRNYSYKKSYAQAFEVTIGKPGAPYVRCDSYEKFKSMAQSGTLENLSYLEVRLNMTYKRGTGNNLEEFENKFSITFRPYDIKFIRISDHVEANMDQVEQQMLEIINRLPVANCIFCSKRS